MGASRHTIITALSDSKFASYQLVTRLARPRASYPSCVTAYPKPTRVSCSAVEGLIRLRSAAAGLRRDRAVEARKSETAKRRSINVIIFVMTTKLSRLLSILVLACAVFGVASEIQAGTHRGVRLIVQRAPNFGNELAVQLSIDGVKVANIPRDQHYEGALSSGRHVLTVLALPNTEQRRPTSVSVTVRSGRTYIFTAGWDANRLVLRRSRTYVPTTAVPPVR